MNELFIIFNRKTQIENNAINYLIEKGKNVKVYDVNQHSDLLINYFDENEFKNLFNMSRFSKYHIVTSCSSDPKSCSEKDVLIFSKIIDKVRPFWDKITTFLLISSTHVRRPFSWISLELNFQNMTQWNKAQIENKLRQSGLSYLIIRHGNIINNNNSSMFTVSQGDTINGSIYSGTVGKLLVDTIINDLIPRNCSFECVSNKEQLNQPYSYIPIQFRFFRPETQDERRLINHKNIIYGVYAGASLVFVYLFYRLIKINFKSKINK